MIRGLFDLWYKESLGSIMRPYQAAMVDRVYRQRKPILINKARQTGISTTVAAIAAACAMQREKILVCSNKEENAVHILEYATDFIRAADEKIGEIPRFRVEQKTKIIFENGGEVRCFSANPSTARGYPANIVFFDEYAHFKGEANLDKKMYEAVAPSISHVGGIICTLSTPFGMQNEFARMWFSPDTPKDQKLTIHYSECPTLKVREEMLPYGKRYWVGESVFSEAAFKQEFCNEFDPGAGTAIPTDAIWGEKVQVGDNEAWD